MKRHTVIQPDELDWRPSNMMKIPNADYLERTGSELMGARLWKLPPMSAMTLHKHNRMEEFYCVLEGTGRIRVDGVTETIERHGGIHVAPESVRQVFNDTEETVLWLIVGAPERELDPGQEGDMSIFYPRDPKRLPPELEGHTWPKEGE